jgi:hypothetical protein
MRAHSIVIAIALAAAGPAAAVETTYFPTEQVTAAFAKGAVLFDGKGTNYMVHASRRETAGQVEVHVTDTEVIYVLDGSAVFVTGGSISAPSSRPSSPPTSPGATPTAGRST